MIKRKCSKATFYRKVRHNTAIALELSQLHNTVNSPNNIDSDSSSENIENDLLITDNDIDIPEHISEGNISDRSDYDNSPMSCNNSEESLNNSSNSTDVDNNIENRFIEQLRSWAVTNNISHSVLKELLKILKSSGGHVTLPVDPRTLLSTPRTNLYKSIGSGKYSHIGIKQAVDKLLNFTNKPLTKIDLLINIDGLPLSKSSSNQIYPILCSIFGYSNVSVIEIYHGYEKPISANDFLQDFMEEAAVLTQNGFIFQEHTLPHLLYIY